MNRSSALPLLAALAVGAALSISIPLLAQEPALPQPLPPGPKACAIKLKTLDLKTGVDEASNTVLPLGAADLTWTVISDPDPGTSEPRPATVIPKYSAWSAPFPGTQWISSYGNSTNDLNGLYQFETCFCLGPEIQGAKLAVTVLVDDWAEIFLNGSSLGSTPHPFNFQTPTTLPGTKPALFKAGRNCLRVDLKNTGSVAMGLDIAATLQTAGAVIERPACCNPTGALSGRKWNDLNGDGQMQAGEPPLAGWVIKLSSSQVAVTDSLGYYHFLNLAPGSYTVSEQQQPGWKQTAPLTGSHTVGLAAGQAVNGLDFGNRRCPQCQEGQIVSVPAGSPGAAELCARLCCKPGEFRFDDSCGCGCGAKPPCPPLGALGVRYVSTDPKVCATVRFVCREGEEPFSDECGCGCKPRPRPTGEPGRE